MIKRWKYSRTPHLPWSPGITNDDQIIQSIDFFIGKKVVITEKMDGENTSMYRDYIHARSIESSSHPSRDWVKNFWNSLRYDIPEEMRICGENMFAEHSIHYSNLKSYFLGFSIWTNEICLSWKETKELFSILNIESVPIIYEGIYDQHIIDNLTSTMDFTKHEGYVIRLEDSFLYDDFNISVAKFVRSNHVTTDKHWSSKKIIPNDLLV